MNLYDMRFDTRKKATFASAVLTIAVLSLLSISLAVLCSISCRQAKNMNRESLKEFVNKYPKLYEGLKVGDSSTIKRLTVVWTPLYLLRLTVTYVVLLSLKNYPGLQVISLLIISVVQ
jgi:hypothetical protein